MDIITVGGQAYGVVITQDDAGAEIGLWREDEQVASIVIDEREVSAHHFALLLTPLAAESASPGRSAPTARQSTSYAPPSNRRQVAVR